MICNRSCLFSTIILSGKNSTFWAIYEKLREALLVSLTDEWLANKNKLAKIELNCYLDIGVHLNIAKHSKYTKRNLRNVKLRKKIEV